MSKHPPALPHCGPARPRTRYRLRQCAFSAIVSNAVRPAVGEAVRMAAVSPKSSSPRQSPFSRTASRAPIASRRHLRRESGEERERAASRPTSSVARFTRWSIVRRRSGARPRSAQRTQRARTTPARAPHPVADTASARRCSAARVACGLDFPTRCRAASGQLLAMARSICTSEPRRTSSEAARTSRQRASASIGDEPD